VVEDWSKMGNTTVAFLSSDKVYTVTGTHKQGNDYWIQVPTTNSKGEQVIGWLKYASADMEYPLVTSLDTGGYTGNWGPEGKLAMLHEKELVLNAQDTKNFLSATEILREIN
jgi:hypothetical protein